MLLHQSLAGCVIGKGGAKIKELKDVSTEPIINWKHFKLYENLRQTCGNLQKLRGTSANCIHFLQKSPEKVEQTEKKLGSQSQEKSSIAHKMPQNSWKFAEK